MGISGSSGASGVNASQSLSPMGILIPLFSTALLMTNASRSRALPRSTLGSSPHSTVMMIRVPRSAAGIDASGPLPSRSVKRARRRTAVDGNALARDRRCMRRGEEEHHRRNVRRLDDTADRELFGEARLGFFLAHTELLRSSGEARGVAVGLGEGRVDDVRRNARGCHRYAELLHEGDE